ncbi:unnamed protein product [Danaus chrysippus]|uniref:(African queen) hypothetical protein n=1 Tax=Danaus chrysippus TaxID=151541 RepID=A0A8J2QFE4_9NEOP|nr:unnamed protein product [Danaus chrysippus]
MASLRATACCRFGGNRGPGVLPNGRLVSSRRFQCDLLRFLHHRLQLRVGVLTTCSDGQWIQETQDRVPA